VLREVISSKEVCWEMIVLCAAKSPTLLCLHTRLSVRWEHTFSSRKCILDCGRLQLPHDVGNRFCVDELRYCRVKFAEEELHRCILTGVYSPVYFHRYTYAGVNVFAAHSVLDHNVSARCCVS
jgi:hypothetical protein